MQIEIKNRSRLEVYPTRYIHGEPQEGPVYDEGQIVGKMKIASPKKAVIELYESRFHNYEIAIEVTDPRKPCFRIFWKGEGNE